MVATACVYLRRFYVRRCLCEYDPRAVAPACLYLAAKAEEAQAQAKALFHFTKKLNASGARLPVAAPLQILYQPLLFQWFRQRKEGLLALPACWHSVRTDFVECFSVGRGGPMM